MDNNATSFPSYVSLQPANYSDVMFPSSPKKEDEMRLLKIINEGCQWIAIGVFLVFIFSVDIDFFKSSPKRTNDLESRIEQQESRVMHIEKRLAQLNSDVEGFKGNQNAVKLQEQIDILRLDLDNLTSSDISQSEITPNEKALQSLPWYKQVYVWISTVAPLVLLTLLQGYVKKRKMKPILSVISGFKNDQSVESKRDCA